ncbi:hypothetical protein LX36DRAFT_465523 [Colletotrichum falcatum]|nr:hypothetical protein LX36DRAFT_465523 [Colletotrichum falcatum]
MELSLTRGTASSGFLALAGMFICRQGWWTGQESRLGAISSTRFYCLVQILVASVKPILPTSTSLPRQSQEQRQGYLAVMALDFWNGDPGYIN